MLKNRVLVILTLSDTFMILGWGLIMPIIAVFITDYIPNGNVAIAGIASTIYLVTRSIIQIPVAHFLDKYKGNLDEFWMMVLGNMVLSLTAIGYLYSSHVLHIIALQVFYGIGTGITFPGWYGLFTRYIDKDKESTEWSIYATLTDIGAGVSAGIGGAIAFAFGYKTLFLLTALLSFGAGIILFLIKKQISKIKVRS